MYRAVVDDDGWYSEGTCYAVAAVACASSRSVSVRAGLAPRVIGADPRPHILGIGMIGRSGEPDQVTKRHRDRLALLAPCPGCPFERLAACQAIPGDLRIHLPTPITRRHHSSLKRP